MLPRPLGRAAAFLALLALLAVACSPGPNQTPAPSSTTAARSPAASGSAQPPVAPSGSASGSPPSGPSAPVGPSVEPSPSFCVYTVARGDSLLGIARRYNTSGRSIAYWSRDTYPSLDPDSKSYQPNRIEI